MVRAVAAIFALIILAMIGVGGLDAALREAGDDFTVVNETWTPDAGNVTDLENSNLTGAFYSDTVEVYDENKTLQDAETDYIWYSDNGTIQAVVGGGLENDSNATVTYTYQQTTEEQRTYTRLAGLVPKSISVIIPVFVFLLFLMMMKGGM